eukprot:CAMPEP_0172862336 /NCGR_PEP_ID=MMETSP1075-20121228/73911_1 /TAXON_ID=2916 /ORGANISM="Ceratium fusus, Strain PA161109" /LENGTH=51 /DNA_ID=CAMNT_0013710637 /DNA_START=1 /DNA_END=153 /DNA_ORIENTATION=-
MDIKAVEFEIEATKEDREKQKRIRNRDNAEFKQALKDDQSAVQLLKQAITL